MGISFHDLLEQQKIHMFPTEDSTPEAINTANELLSDSPSSDVMQSLCIYHNTLLSDLQRRWREQSCNS